VKVEGARGLRPGEILDAALLKTGDIYNAAKARLDEQAKRRLYLEKGYADATVSSDTEPGRGENSLVLVFRISEGSQVAIKEIRFEGNHTLASSSLKSNDPQERGCSSPGFQEPKLEADRRQIEDLYQSGVRGRAGGGLRGVRKEEGAAEDAP
jgi:outer membrane protein assembly factor BamA